MTHRDQVREHGKLLSFGRARQGSLMRLRGQGLHCVAISPVGGGAMIASQNFKKATGNNDVAMFPV